MIDRWTKQKLKFFRQLIDFRKFFCAKRVQDDLRDLRLREFFSQIQWDTVLDHAKEIRPSDENCCENISIREAEKCFFFAVIHQHVLIFTTLSHSVPNLW